MKKYWKIFLGIIDFIKYYVLFHKMQCMFLIIEFCAIVYTINSFSDTFNSSNNTEIHSKILFSFLSLVLLYDLLKFFYGIKKAIYLTNSKIELVNHNYMELELSQKEKENGFEKLVLSEDVSRKLECVIFSKELNKSLNDNDWKIVIGDKLKQQVRVFIKNHKGILFPFLIKNLVSSIVKGRDFFNEEKLCLSRDLEIKSETVVCHKGTYFDSYLTNEATGKVLRAYNSGSLKFDARPYSIIDGLYSKSKQIQDISTSINNNHLGGSSLALTKDNYFIWWIQNNSAQFSNDLLAPTGSGSCDFNDLSPNKSLKETILNNMHRELMEESSLTKYINIHNHIANTYILGYYRWITRGGLPQFVGITKLNLDLNQLSPNHEEVKEDSENKSMNKFLVRDLSSLNSFIHYIKNGEKKISVPMYMTIIFLEEMLTNNSMKITSFLNLEIE